MTDTATSSLPDCAVAHHETCIAHITQTDFWGVWPWETIPLLLALAWPTRWLIRKLGIRTWKEWLCLWGACIVLGVAGAAAHRIGAFQIALAGVIGSSVCLFFIIRAKL